MPATKPEAAGLPSDPTKPMTTRRDRAFWVGLVLGILSLGLAVFVGLVGTGFVVSGPILFEDQVVGLAIMAGVLLLIGGFAYWKARQLDERNYMIEKAPPLPLHLVHAGDDAWIEGLLRVPNPAIAPHFGTTCCWYRYRQWERRGSGKNKRWSLVTNDVSAVRTMVQAGERMIEVDIPNAIIDNPKTFTRHTGNYKHQLTYVPSMGAVGIVGVVDHHPNAPRTKPVQPQPTPVPEPETAGEQPGGAVGFMGLFGGAGGKKIGAALPARQPTIGAHFEAGPATDDIAADSGPALWMSAAGNVPLMLTTLPREEWVDKAEATETTLGVVAGWQLWGALTLGIWAIAAYLGLVHSIATVTFLAPGAIALAILVPMWGITLYNRFVAYKARVAAAWAQIDVDLKMRRTVLPQLVDVVKATSAHEADTQEMIARLQSRAVPVSSTPAAVFQAESAAHQLAQGLTVLVEGHPDLKSNTSYMKLHDTLVAIEEKIAWGRRFYNLTVREYNDMVGVLPNSMVAGAIGFAELPFWKTDDE